jgi:hypothetical protein
MELLNSAFHYTSYSSLLLFILFCLLQVADVLSTVEIIRTGKGHEANPVMFWLQSHLGTITGLAAPKLVVMVLFWFWVVPTAQAVFILAAMCLVYMMVLWNNYGVWKKTQE